MRRTMVVGVLVGAAMLGGSSALAAPPEISQRSCEESGGTFSRDQGVKSCTHVTQAEVAGPWVSLLGPVSRSGNVETQVVGTSRRIDMVRTTTTDSQKGNGEVTTTTRTATVSSRVEEGSCELRTTTYSLFGSPTVRFTPTSFGDCHSYNLFLTP